MVGSVAAKNSLVAKANPGSCLNREKGYEFVRNSNGSEDRQSEVCRPKSFNAIQQPLQHCDKPPTQEAEPHDHYRYDQYGKGADRELPACLRR